jgi:uncharacterized membrane protein
VLLSVVFLFDYAVDRGWLTPPVRVAFGLALGAVLAAVGLRVQRKERWFSQLMLGGASASWYITGFAAFQVLEILSYPVAFVFMIAVTVFTFWMGIRQDEAVLGALGAIGGLGTPFFLYSDQGSLPALVGYTCLVVLGTSGIYLLRGWRSLLWTSVIGGWAVLVLASADVTVAQRWVLQCGIAALWLMFWSVAACRSLLESASPTKWHYTRPSAIGALSEHDLAATPHASSALLVVALPLLALLFSRSVWETGDTIWGSAAAAVAVTYAAVALLIRARYELAILASAHAVAAAALMTVAIALLFKADVNIVLWTALAIALLYLGRSYGETALSACGHLLFAVVGFWLLQRLGGGVRPETAIFSARGLSDAFVIAGMMVASKWAHDDFRKWFVVAGYVGLLGWLWRELSVLPAGEAIVTTTYGVLGLGLLAASAQTRKAGLVTLLIAVAKLFLVDLDRVDPFLRVLLFLGFGSLFLGISYYYRGRWLDSDQPEAASEE